MHSFVLAQTYAPAPSLQKVVETGQLFSEAETIAIAQQLLTTLNYLHQQLPPVIHRDLKPSNILIGEPFPRATAGLTGVLKRNVHLVDFGAVQITASKQQRHGHYRRQLWLHALRTISRTNYQRVQEIHLSSHGLRAAPVARHRD